MPNQEPNQPPKMNLASELMLIKICVILITLFSLSSCVHSCEINSTIRKMRVY